MCARYGYEFPPLDWERALVREDQGWERVGDWSPASDFEDRFQELVQSVAGSWINVNLRGVNDGIYYVGVEFTLGDPLSDRWHPDTVSVNLSGPPIKPPWIRE
jgi:hypothetical protein